MDTLQKYKHLQAVEGVGICLRGGRPTIPLPKVICGWIGSLSLQAGLGQWSWGRDCDKEKGSLLPSGVWLVGGWGESPPPCLFEGRHPSCLCWSAVVSPQPETPPLPPQVPDPISPNSTSTGLLRTVWVCPLNPWGKETMAGKAPATRPLRLPGWKPEFLEKVLC